MNYAEVIFSRNTRTQRKECIDDGEQPLVYLDFLLNFKKVAGWLVSKGVQPYDTVVIKFDDCSEWPVLFMACQWIGAIPVIMEPGANTSTKLHSREPKLIIDHKDAFELSEEAKIPYLKKSSETGAIWFRQGNPIEVPLFAFLFQSHALYYHNIIDSNMRMLCEPKCHTFVGFGHSIRDTLYWGGTTKFMPGEVTIQSLIKNITQFDPTHLVLKEHMVKQLLANGNRHTLKNVAIVICDDATADTHNKFTEHFAKKLITGAHCTKFGGYYVANNPDNYEQGTMGTVLNQIEYRKNSAGMLEIKTPSRAQHEVEWMSTNIKYDITDKSNIKLAT